MEPVDRKNLPDRERLCFENEHATEIMDAATTKAKHHCKALVDSGKTAWYLWNIDTERSCS
jgi:hypothetical protein